ncbi:MAG: xanthine dehydrogenase family protein molybdopterin-binding subunit [Rhizobiaceae bacterium]
MKFGIGQSVSRKEDDRFVSGRGLFVEDLDPPDALHAAFFRSDVAHARIKRIDVSAAKAVDGVVAVLTAADSLADGLGGLSCHTLSPQLHRNQAGHSTAAIAGERILYVGTPLAVVVAETRNIARDAAELIEVDYEYLDGVFTIEQAIADGAPVLRDDAPGNIAFELDIGDASATDAAFRKAAHTIEIKLRNNRVSANAMEMRGAVASYDARLDRLVFHTSTQAPHSVRTDLASALGLPPASVRVVAPDVGGGFGMKGGVYAEDILTAWCAWRLKRTVRWHADRTESLLTDYHGRDQTVMARLALDTEGRFLGLRVHSDFNTGAHLSTGAGVSPMLACALATGCYKFQAAHATGRAVLTNTSPTQPYRGAGRPEAAFLIERLVDKAARETGIDRIELRRRNLVRTEDMPYKMPLIFTIDAGDYAALMDRALELAVWQDAEKRKKAAAARNRLYGIGIALHLENAGLANEAAEIRIDQSGGATVVTGTFSHGQGHETVFAQMVSEWLGVPFDRIRFVQGDTDAVDLGRGTVASRSMVNGGSALQAAADKIVEKGRLIAGHMMEAAADDVTFEAGDFTVTGTDRRVTLAQVAAFAHQPMLPPHLGMGLSSTGDFALQGFTFPCGCQIAEVEICRDTGSIELLGIHSVDDVGTVINPMLLDGQLVGGIAQGIGQALMEDIVYDESGQLISSSFLDYCMPRADDIPPITIETQSTPTASNPLGVKGAGEAGTVGATPAVISAVLDALEECGITDIEMPATPERVWRAIHGKQ